MEQELGPSGLVRRAIERGEGAGDDWDEYRYRLRQVSVCGLRTCAFTAS